MKLDIFESSFMTILGFGCEGQSTYRFLIEQGYDPDYILVRDKSYEGTLAHGGIIISGDGYLDGIEHDQCIWKTPGITATMLAQQGVDIDKIRHKFTSQTEYFLKQYQGTVIGVTGTKGKSTTSALIAQMIADTGKSVILAGNIGKPIFDLIDFSDSPEFIVYEFSSYMLESLNQSDRQITYGMITCLFPHVHVKEHGSEEAYIHAKCEILKHSKKQFVGVQAWNALHSKKFILHNVCIFGGTQKGLTSADMEVIYHNGFFRNGTQQLFETDCVGLLGEHNLYNICGVISVGLDLGIDEKSIKQTISVFKGLEHRLEYVGNYGGIDRYNDAIATTPDATLAAMKSFGDRLGTLFLGGIEGPYQFDKVVESCKLYSVDNVILFPDSGKRIKALLEQSGFKGRIFESLDMNHAVQLAYDNTSRGKVALLSCGSPSFSLRSGFEEKGKLFKQAILDKSTTL